MLVWREIEKFWIHSKRCCKGENQKAASNRLCDFVARQSVLPHRDQEKADYPNYKATGFDIYRSVKQEGRTNTGICLNDQHIPVTSESLVVSKPLKTSASSG